MKIDDTWTRPICVVSVPSAMRRGTELAVYDAQSGEKIDNIVDVTVWLSPSGAMSATVGYLNAENREDSITSRDLVVDVASHVASRDWEALTLAQRTDLAGFRERMLSHLQEEAKVFYAAHPDLWLSWSFSCDALFRERARLTQITRVDKAIHALQPGEMTRDSRGDWYLGCPGTHVRGVANLSGHTVTVHADGAVTVSPSIACGGCGAHYFVERNHIRWC